MKSLQEIIGINNKIISKIPNKINRDYKTILQKKNLLILTIMIIKN